MAQGPASSSTDEVAEVKMLLETERNRRKAAEEEVEHLKSQLGKHTQAEVRFKLTGKLFCFFIFQEWISGILETFLRIGRR